MCGFFLQTCAVLNQLWVYTQCWSKCSREQKRAKRRTGSWFSVAVSGSGRECIPETQATKQNPQSVHAAIFLFLSFMSLVGTLALFSPLAVLFRFWANIFDSISYLYIYIIFESSMREGQETGPWCFMLCCASFVICTDATQAYFTLEKETLQICNQFYFSFFSDALKSPWLNALYFQQTFKVIQVIISQWSALFS